MQLSPEKIGQLLRQVQQGSAEAETVLLKLLAPWIRMLIHTKLDMRVRRLVDPADVAQDVYRALLPHLGASMQIQDPEKFLSYLARIVHNQTLKANRRYLGIQKRQLQIDDQDSEME